MSCNPKRGSPVVPDFLLLVQFKILQENFYFEQNFDHLHRIF
jgi:hypothetical protein